MSRARSPRSFTRTAGMLVSALAVAALVAPAVPAIAADPTAITPVEVLEAAPSTVRDPLGTPSASSLVAADTVLTTGGSLRSAVQASADLSSSTSTGSAANVVSLPDLNPQFATAAGRFTDDGAERALALRLGDLQGAAVLTLASTSAALEGQSRGAKLTALPAAGTTLQFAACGAQACAPKNFLAADTTQPAGLGGVAVAAADPGGVGAPGLEWSLRGSGGSFHIVNGLTGLCLTARDGNAVTAPCGAALGQSGAPVEQTWTIAVGAGGTVTTVRTQVAGATASLYLDVDGMFRVAAALPVGAEDVFSLLPVQQTGGVVPTWSAPNLARDPGRGFDLATGDLDRAVVNDAYRDEAAVAYLDDAGDLRVAIIDYSRPEGMQVTETAAIASGNVAGAVSAEIGDFNGDGSNEIAVTFYTQDSGLRVAFVGYTAPGEATLLAASIVDQNGAATLLAGGMTTAAGDFIGTGRDALAVAFIGPGGGDYVQVMALTFSGDGFDRTGSATYSTELAATVTTEQGRLISRGPRLVAALLAADGTAGAPNPARRQLMVAVPTQAGRSCYRALQADQPAGGTLTVTSMGAPYCADAVVSTTSGDAGNAFAPIQLAAGGFAGRAAESGSLPRWGVATLVGPSSTSPHLMMLSVTEGALVEHDLGATSGSTDSTVTLTAFDQKNETLRLGAPVVVELQHLQTPTMIAAAPPAHVDWIFNASSNKDAFVNVSASPNLAIAMSDSKTESFSSTTDTMFGGSASLSVKASAKETVAGSVGVASGKESTELSISASATLAGADTKSSEHSSSKTTSQRSRTVTDDLLRLKVASQRIFRYPILGGNTAVTPDGSGCEQGCTAYYDVYVPTDTAAVTTDAGGRTIDTYSPPWHNGNVLSYPTSAMEAPGAWSFVDNNGKTVIKTEYLLEQGYRLDGASSDTTLAVTTIDNTTHKSESSGTFKQGVDVKQYAKAKVDVGIGSETTEGSGEVSVNVSESFSHTATGKTSTTTTSGLELLAPAVANGGYGFTTYYYYLAGASKVNYSVDLAAVDKEFWNANYGQEPDPALSLPNAIELADNGAKPQFSTEFTRQKIRGFRALEPSAGGPQTASEYTSAPRTGDPVTFAVDVHNYSLAGSAPTTVEFFAVPINPVTMAPTGPPQQIGGAATIAAIGPQATVTAYSDTWAAAGPSAAGQSIEYNIFVVLNRQGDPDAEIHPYTTLASGAHNVACPTTRDNSNFAFASKGTVDSDGFMIDPMTGKRDVTACGQNNQGFGSITVLGKAAAAARVAATDVATPANVRLAGAGFVTDDAALRELDETSAVPQLTEGIATPSVVKVASDQDYAGHQLVMIYDGDPEDGGTLIASTTLQGTASETGGYARYTWNPTGVGEHKLYQKVYGSSQAGSSDAQIVTVNVLAPPTDPTGPTPSPTAGNPDDTNPTGDPGAERPNGRLPSTGSSVPMVAIVVAAVAFALGAVLLSARARSRRGRRG